VLTKTQGCAAQECNTERKRDLHPPDPAAKLRGLGPAEVRLVEVWEASLLVPWYLREGLANQRSVSDFPGLSTDESSCQPSRSRRKGKCKATSRSMLWRPVVLCHFHHLTSHQTPFIIRIADTRSSTKTTINNQESRLNTLAYHQPWSAESARSSTRRCSRRPASRRRARCTMARPPPRQHPARRSQPPLARRAFQRYGQLISHDTATI
jgi:hypothetical protein